MLLGVVLRISGLSTKLFLLAVHIVNDKSRVERVGMRHQFYSLRVGVI